MVNNSAKKGDVRCRDNCLYYKYRTYSKDHYCIWWNTWLPFPEEKERWDPCPCHRWAHIPTRQ